MQMSIIFILKIEPSKNRRYFLMGDPIYMNTDAFRETSSSFVNCAVLQFFPKYSQRYVNLNVKSGAKFKSLLKVDGLL